MFGSVPALPVLVIAVIGLAAVPVSLALDGAGDTGPVTVEGEVKGFVCCDEECDLCLERASAFLLETDDGETVVVEFGPWWYWMVQEVTVRDIVSEGDRVEVTGEPEEDCEGVRVLSAWRIENLDTGDEITIKVEGCPPWAGGPKELGIDPWPPPREED